MRRTGDLTENKIRLQQPVASRATRKWKDTGRLVIQTIDAPTTSPPADTGRVQHLYYQVPAIGSRSSIQKIQNNIPGVTACRLIVERKMTKASFSPEKTRSPQPQHPPRTPARINHRLVLFIISLTAEVPRPAGRRYDPTRTPSYRPRSGPAIRRARRRPHTSGSGDGDAAGGKATPCGLRQNGMSRSSSGQRTSRAFR